MGFNSVYKVLQEVFPQVDSRILRAVAIENSKDADVAVGVVLSEVMPSLSVKSANVATSLNQGPSFPNPCGDVEVSNTADGTYSTAVNHEVSEEVITSQQLPSRKPGESIFSEFDIPYENFISSGPNNITNEVQDQVFVDAMDEFGGNINLPGRHQVSSVEEGQVFPRRLNMLTELGNRMLNETDGFKNSLSLHEEEQSSLDELVRKNHRSATPVADEDPAAVQIISPNNSEGNSQLLTEPILPVTEVKEPEADVPFLTASGGDIGSSEMADCQNVNMVNIVSDISVKDPEKEEPSWVNSLFADDMGDFKDETSMKGIVTSRSGQMYSAELLEGIIETEKIEKIALRSAKDSLLSFINEVEMKEKSVEEAKEEAARGGLDTLARVEDLKKMLQRAKEANDMHAGEVYGEKAILSTEMRELQSRLRNLSDERVKALAILDEIHQALEVRLVSAEAEIKEAELEKLEKEESALKYLAHEESRMQKVVEESKILEQQAEENSKLREFLIDRGRLVDILQGEISVIFQDVKSMKTKFDLGVPLSKSLSSSQTTSVSTFSSSSGLGASFEKLPEPEVVASPKDGKAALNSRDDELLYGNEIFGTGMELVDDGWELFNA
ncbi:nuclear mitotic apparatus protein 1-like [Heracleum sosnowskyi]|uniref:Nuclear mitotic apparatus protein 1-like n=1 Tax=Heracleum sosnowskyi TaxID=360622 RepID=A0AAD8HTB8_9APIA|nr:nuclear mitotic apparatus protein 1-like [Heracleum sosnowskyi]